MKILREPKIYLVARQVLGEKQLGEFLDDEGMKWETDTDVPAEELAEIAGRVCYMSFGKGRKSNEDYLQHIKEVKHGSVTEHAVYSFIITGISRSLTHELVRHRAGWAYSQLSQRYVDETDCNFIEPDLIADDPELHELFTKAIHSLCPVYTAMTDRLTEIIKQKYPEIKDRTTLRKMARQAARCILPNATETKIMVTANVRALRHFIELRANPAADLEIRKLAVMICRIMQSESPNLFGDYEIYSLPDGTEACRTNYIKI
ncbi:MAG TPA: FAD-dependent thymidylate synthase [Firmicutes bacterium]|nr:FAD-dependent thymidylate synthase [Bacillota bacterium]